MKVRGMLGLALAIGLTGCSFLQADPYPLHAGSTHSSQTSPQKVGTATRGVVLWLSARPGDEIELLDAQPIGVAGGATVRFYFSPPIQKDDHGTVITVIGEKLEPLAGAVFSNDAASSAEPRTIGIVAEITSQQAGRYELSNVRLRYRVNGGEERVGEGIDVTFTVCAEDPAPASCELSPSP